jgi:hypothetical protein
VRYPTTATTTSVTESTDSGQPILKNLHWPYCCQRHSKHGIITSSRPRRLTEIQNRGVKVIFICCVDGPKGFPDAIQAVYRRIGLLLHPLAQFACPASDLISH